MKEFRAEEIRIEAVSALETVKQVQVNGRYPAFIGLDVHKETIVFAVAWAGRAPESRGEIANKPKAVAKLVERLNEEFGGEVLLFLPIQTSFQDGSRPSYPPNRCGRLAK